MPRLSLPSLGRFGAVLALLAGLLSVSVHADDKKEEVSVKVVKFKELISTIKEQKGKVVVVDFWADY